MPTHIELTRRAFAVLESLPQKTAFGIFRSIDRLTYFPEIGSPMENAFPGLKGLRQLVYKRRFRIIYEYSLADEQVMILAILDSRQMVPERDALSSETDTDDQDS